MSKFDSHDELNNSDTGMSEINKPLSYIGIGASAGGLEAIESFFKNMKPDSGMAFVVIQHLSPDYKSLMVELLSKKTNMDVIRAVDGMTVEKNKVYLIPPKMNMTIYHGKLLLNEQITRGINLPIDIFLRSLAEDQAEKSVAIILSGTGSDGTRGVRAIKEHGGMVMVQDEESARFDGMPRAAVSTGLADFILSPEEMPDQLLAYSRHPYVTKGTIDKTVSSNEGGLAHIYSMLREKTKVDFTYYKQTTIVRRIERRITVNQLRSIKDYVDYLREYPGEIFSLYRELLIGVTNFFRDPDAFELLEKKFLPDLLKKNAASEIRFWVAGCSTGEEAYSLAILTRETMEKLGISRDVKIFATDIDRDAILKAGQGLYPESITADLNPRLLSKYFYRKEDNYQVARNIREMVVFAQHNLVKDPPFTNINLVSCRNLLIYLQPVLQQKALDMFNFALNIGGILFLGSSESIGEMGPYFEILDHRSKLYRSKGKTHGRVVTNIDLKLSQSYKNKGIRNFSDNRKIAGYDDSNLIDRILSTVAKSFIPLTVIVNERMEIVHTIGETEGFFKLPSGKPVNDISKMVSKELSIPLLTGIQKVFRSKENLTYTNIKLKNFDDDVSLKLNINLMPEKKGEETFVAVFLEKVKKESSQILESDLSNYDISKEADQRIRDLESELQFTKENLQATIEELETSNEELQATNEELLASNEELQSTNEELQSTNEELHTVNGEYQNKIIELTELHNDVDNLLTSSGIGELLLDENLEIRKYSPEITNIFKIMEQDIGRPLSHLSNNLVNFDPVESALEVIKTNKIMEKDVRATDNKWYLIRIMPYHIGPETFSGIVMTFIDVSELKKSQTMLAENLKRTNDILKHIPSGIFIYRVEDDNKLILETGNNEAEKQTGIIIEKSIGREFNEIWPQAENIGISENYLQAYKTGITYYNEEIKYVDDNTAGFYRVYAFKLPENRLGVSFENITTRKKVENELSLSQEKYKTMFETMAQGVVYQDNNGEIITANESAEKILGLTLDQMKGRTSMDSRWKATDGTGSDLPGDSHPAMVTLKTGKPVSNFIMGVFNPIVDEQRWILVNSHPCNLVENGKFVKVFTTFEDITEIVKAEDQIKKVNIWLDYAFSFSGIAWWEWDIKADLVTASPRKAEMIGYKSNETGTDLEFWTSKIHPADFDKTMKAMKDYLEGKVKLYSAEYRLKTKKGDYILCKDRGEAISRDISGKPVKMIGTVVRIK